MKEKYFFISDTLDSIDCKIYANDMNSIDKIILCCHGFCGNKENRATYKIANHFISNYDGVGIICFDWPCHGKDVKQKLSLVDCDRYLSKIINYIENDLGIKELYLQATSFGGYLSLKYIYEHENPFKKIVLRCPAINMLDILIDNICSADNLIDIKKGKYALVGSNNQRKIKINQGFLNELANSDIGSYEFYSIADDTIVLQGNDDELVNPDLISLFCENNVIECYRMDGTNHIFSDPAKMKKAIDYMDDFFCIDKSKKL